MAVSVKHAFVSAIPDSGDATIVQPSNWNDEHTVVGLGTAAEADTVDFATSAQGTKADSAVQPGDLAAVATSGAYSDLSGTPTLGTAAAADVGDFATAAQGTKADSALQPGAIGVSVQAYDADLSAWAGVNPSSYSTSAQIAAAYQPLDSDLTALAAAGNSGVLAATTASFTTADETKLDGLREKLTAARTYYVDDAGSNSNNGLTIGAPFLTVQKAVDVAQTLDTNGFDVIIAVLAGTYTAGATIAGALVGGGTLNIIGDTTTPGNVIVNATSADCFFATEGAIVVIRGFKLTTTTSGNCLNAAIGSYLLYGNIEFGSCAGMHINFGSESLVYTAFNCTISGGAQGHFHGGSPGTLITNAITITLTGTPAFSVYFAGTAGAYLTLNALNFSGSATGKRYLAHKNGVIDVGTTSETFLPGSVAGTTESGGKYVGDVTLPDLIGNSGSYTPTLSSLVNLDSATPATFRWNRSGNVINVVGYVTTDATTASLTSTTFEMTLPVNAAANPSYVLGLCSGASANENGIVLAVAAANRAKVYYSAQLTTANTMVVQFSYGVASTDY